MHVSLNSEKEVQVVGKMPLEVHWVLADVNPVLGGNWSVLSHFWGYDCDHWLVSHVVWMDTWIHELCTVTSEDIRLSPLPSIAVSHLSLKTQKRRIYRFQRYLTTETLTETLHQTGKSSSGLIGNNSLTQPVNTRQLQQIFSSILNDSSHNLHINSSFF